MIEANAFLAVEQESIATGTSGKRADFQSKCKHVTLHCTEDAYISFDRPVQSGDFFLKADVMIDIKDIEFTYIEALQVTSGGVLYILARR